MIAYHQTLFPESLKGTDLDLLLSVGWYRMHQTVFTTTHVANDDIFYRVHWLRYPLVEIAELPAHRRIRKRSKDFQSRIEDFTDIPLDHEVLYARYRESIDFNGPRSVRQGLFGDEGIDRDVYTTKVISVFDQDKLVAVGYFDVGATAAASILHFFDPAYKNKSLGKYLLLLTADYLKANGFTFYYPGYLVAGLPKMDYKLFMGKTVTWYFDPETKSWKQFEDAILKQEVLTEAGRLELMLAFYG